jgi:uncharacterized membrane protein YdjX (TVP38/TMEM64 family)
MRDLVRSLPVVLLVLAIPIIPYLLWGGTLEAWVHQFEKDPPDPELAALAVVALLATDIFLPIPSSLVSTFGGGQLGWLLGTLASWLGMTLGAVAGFALARWLGPAFAYWFARRESLDNMHQLSERFGPGIVVLTRGVPVLAEACVLLLGLQRLSWARFLPPLMLSNLGLALVYSLFGYWAAEMDSMVLALIVSILLPVIVAVVVQRILGPRESQTSD